MTNHIYFDLDGTLTDPYEGISKCILYAVNQLGFPRPSEEFLMSSIGPPLYDTFPELVGTDLTLQAIDLYRKRFDDLGWCENIPYEGIHEALTAIANTDCTMFVATSKPRAAAQRIVEHFEMGQFFETVYGSELDGTRANKVDLLKYAIEENPEATSRAMIGDRRHDLNGATANNMTPIGVAYGYGSVSELTSAGAVAIAKTPAELPNYVARPNL